MGSRANHTLKEIESVRDGLGPKLAELERRLPPLVRAGRRAAVVAAGGGAGGSVLWFVLRRRSKRKGARTGAAAPVASAPLVVNVFPKGAVAVGVAAVAVWAGVRIFEAATRSTSREASQGPAVVRPMPEGRQARSS